jgi:hypothetical protein
LRQNQSTLHHGAVLISVCAHERFFNAAVEKNAAADYFLAARTDDERNANALRSAQIWELNFVQTVCAL